MKSPTENLLNLMNLRLLGIADVIRTSDGFYMGRSPGDIGYNVFIGKPNPNEGPGRRRSRAVWEVLTEHERGAVLARCNHPVNGDRIPLEDFGIEEVVQDART